MYCWNASSNALESIDNDTVSTLIVGRCYFCNSTEHTGRECEAQQRVINKGQLELEVIQASDKSRDGTLAVGDVAPDCELVELKSRKKIQLHEYIAQHFENCNSSNNTHRITVLNFGSMS